MEEITLFILDKIVSVLYSRTTPRNLCVNWRISPFTINHRHQILVNAQLHAPAALPGKEDPRFPKLIKELSGSQQVPRAIPQTTENRKYLACR